jgi:NADPH-dependent 2,4-dienoyl-CoA reductase/sulfur reductase-like enzyme
MSRRRIVVIGGSDAGTSAALSGERRLSYDRLVVATGAEAVVPSIAGL